MKKIREILSKISKSWPLVAICIAVVGLSYWAMFSHYKSFSFSGKNDAIYKVESKLLDLRVLMRGPQKASGKVGILAIDEKSIDQFGRWPFSRKYYAKAFQNLKSLGVTWIGFDSIYAEPEKTYLDEASQSLKSLAHLRGKALEQGLQRHMDSLADMMTTSPSDLVFAKGISEFGNIVLGYFFFGNPIEAQDNLGDKYRFKGLDRMAGAAIQNLVMPEGKSLADYPLVKKAYGIVSNTPIIADSSDHFAFFSNDADDDAINRWVVLVANIDGNLMPSLALKTVAEYLNREIVVFFDANGIENISLVSRDDDADVLELPVDPLGTGRILVNHRGPGRSFHHFSLADAYNNSFTQQERKWLKGSTLLLGATATGTNDIRPNPFDPAIDGVENHAAVMDNVLQRDYFRRPVEIYGTELWIILGVGLLFAPIMIWGRAIVSGAGVIMFLVGYYYADKYLWFQRGTWAYMAIPCCEIVAMFISTTLFKYMTEEREKKKVRGAFSMYLSPDVISQVLENPDQLSLGGVRRELTVFFSDVRGFTTISESLTPEKLCELMNDYFTPMTSIILRSKGVLDKYIGDAIMAFWGAPLDLTDHADRGCQSAIDMQFAMEILKSDFAKKGLPPIDIGIGLNTGLMSVGNMGSGERFCYTVMGDSVNLGSRLESLTKEYGIKIMVSEFTKAKLTPGKFFLRNLDDIRVKGKNEPVNVFDLMRPDFLESPARIVEFIQTFDAGREAYKAQKWVECRRLFENCLKMKPTDKTAAKYVERIQYYEAQSPGENWDGVYTFTHK